MSTEYECVARECAKIEGYLTELFTYRVIDAYPALRIGEDEFRPLTLEEGNPFSFGDEALLIVRKSDGQVFEIEIDVTAWKLKDKTVAWEAK